MRADVKILLLENSRSHGEKQLERIRKFDCKVTRLAAIPSEEDEAAGGDFSVIKGDCCRIFRYTEGCKPRQKGRHLHINDTADR